MGRVVQPSGTVTLVFTDIEGSTRLLSELGQDGYRLALADHRKAVRDAFGRHGGYEVDYEGDAFFYAFASAVGAVGAVAEALKALESGPIRIRVGVHTGEPGLDPPKYVGLDVHKAARIMAAGHGGQVVLSESARALLDESFTVRELGEHRLKDLSGPQRLFQLGEAEFLPLKTLYRTNLPVPATGFVGRERELGELSELLLDGVRLLTLTGPGGTGKTRLGLQVAGAVADAFPDGVWWAPLASLRDPSLVVSALAQALEVAGEAGRELGETLTEVLAGKRLLLLVDNVEHLLPEAATALARVRAADGPKVVVTSRERLQLAGEHVYAVPTLVDGDGVELFLERARALGSEIGEQSAVRELCGRLDNLPLAIELAAARTTVLSPTQILERLAGRLDLLKSGHDADPRQQTLRATIEWSYDLLDAGERSLFARLAIFVGGCTLEAAEEVCGADLDTLAALVDKSLVRRSAGRFWMLEAIRDYGRERLVEGGELTTLQERHARWFAAFSEIGRPRGVSADTFDLLEADHQNLRSALDWAEKSQQFEILLRMTCSLGYFWVQRGHLQDGEARTLRALAVPTPHGAEDRRLELLVYASQSARLTGELDRAVLFDAEARELAPACRDSHLRGRVLSIAGTTAAARGDLEEAQRLQHEALEIFKGASDLWGQSLVTSRLADVSLIRRDFVEAERLSSECLPLARMLGNESAIGVALLNLAQSVLGQGRRDEAAAHAAAAIRHSASSDDQDGFASATVVLAAVIAADNPRHAARLIGLTATLIETIRIALGTPEQRLVDQTTADLNRRLGPAQFASSFDEGRQAGLDMTLAQAEAYVHPQPAT